MGGLRHISEAPLPFVWGTQTISPGPTASLSIDSTTLGSDSHPFMFSLPASPSLEVMAYHDQSLDPNLLGFILLITHQI